MTAPLSVNTPVRVETEAKCDDCICASKCCFFWCARKPRHHHDKPHPAHVVKPTVAFKKEFDPK